jgi:hypothetical protein
MAKGATRQVITAERSRIRRRSSFAVMAQISRRAPRPRALTLAAPRQPTLMPAEFVGVE